MSMTNNQIIERLQQISMELVDKYKSAGLYSLKQSDASDKLFAKFDKEVFKYNQELATLLMDTEEEKSIRAELYAAYMDNMNASRQYQTDILKGIAAGENIYELFLKAVQAISTMTNNKVFYTQIENDLHTIYGEALQDKNWLQAEERLSMLRKALAGELTTDSRRRIDRAVKAHETIC